MWWSNPCLFCGTRAKVKPRPFVFRFVETHNHDDKEGRTRFVKFERKIFRRIYGPKYENGEWKSRVNRELEEMSKGENVVK